MCDDEFRIVSPLKVIQHHSLIVGGLAWSRVNTQIFASGSDDGIVAI